MKSTEMLRELKLYGKNSREFKLHGRKLKLLLTWSDKSNYVYTIRNLNVTTLRNQTDKSNCIKNRWVRVIMLHDQKLRVITKIESIYVTWSES